MSFVNEAYRTLKNPEELREYVLNLHGLKADSGPKGQIPLELAESWFELQDAISDEPSQASEKISAFKKELENLRAAAGGKIRALETELDMREPDSTEYREGLQKLARAVHEASYLASLGRDVERMAARG